MAEYSDIGWSDGGDDGEGAEFYEPQESSPLPQIRGAACDAMYRDSCRWQFDAFDHDMEAVIANENPALLVLLDRLCEGKEHIQHLAVRFGFFATYYALRRQAECNQMNEVSPNSLPLVDEKNLSRDTLTPEKLDQHALTQRTIVDRENPFLHEFVTEGIDESIECLLEPLPEEERWQFCELALSASAVLYSILRDACHGSEQVVSKELPIEMNGPTKAQEGLEMINDVLNGASYSLLYTFFATEYSEISPDHHITVGACLSAIATITMGIREAILRYVVEAPPDRTAGAIGQVWNEKEDPRNSRWAWFWKKCSRLLVGGGVGRMAWGLLEKSPIGHYSFALIMTVISLVQLPSTIRTLRSLKK